MGCILSYRIVHKIVIQGSNWINKLMNMHMYLCIYAYLRHDRNGSLIGSLGYFVLNEKEHVFIIEQADEMEGTKTSGTSKSEITNDH